MKKGAVELSVNFLVLMIISLVIFGLSLAFVYKIMAKADDIQQMTEQDIDRKIEGILCEGNEKVCFPRNVQTIERGGSKFFGMRLRNVLTDYPDTNFIINVEHGGNSAAGYQDDNSEISEPLVWSPKEREINLRANEMKNIGIAVQVPKDALPGKYIFTVTVEYDNHLPPPPEKEYSKNKFYVNVP